MIILRKIFYKISENDFEGATIPYSIFVAGKRPFLFRTERHPADEKNPLHFINVPIGWHNYILIDLWLIRFEHQWDTLVTLKTNEFECDRCHRVFQKERSDEEAKKEAETLWGGLPDEWHGGAAIICDDCFKEAGLDKKL